MRYVLVLQRTGLTVFEAAQGQAGCTEFFSNNDEGVKEFSQFLRRCQGEQFFVVLDLEDEQLHCQKMLKIGRTDRKAMLRHQRRKIYGDSPFASVVIGNHKGDAGPRLGVTHIGLPADMPACAWLTMLEEANVCIHSFHWMSLLMYALLQATGTTDGVTVLLARMSATDDRVLVFCDRQLLICRRIANRISGSEGHESTGTALSEQVIQTIAYLERLSESSDIQLPAGDSLGVIAVGDYTKIEIETINEQLLVAGVKPPQTFSVDTVTSGQYKSKATAQSILEFVVKTVTSRKTFSYSLIFRGVNFLQRRLRHALYAVSISILAGTALVSAATRYATADLTGLESFARELELRTMNIKQTSPHPAWSEAHSIAGIRETVAQINAMKVANQSTPFHFLVLVSEQLTSHASIEVTSIQWLRNDPAVSGDILYGDSKEEVLAPVDSFQPGFNAIVTGHIGWGPTGIADAMNEFRSFVGSMRESAKEIAPASNVTVVTPPFAETSPATRESIVMLSEFRLEVNSRESDR